MNKDRAAVALGLILVGIATLLLTVAFRFPLGTELLQVAMLLLGMVSMAAISTFSKLLERASGPLVHISFNEAQARTVLGEVVDANLVEPAENVVSNPPWEPTSDALLLQDPALALAKLRIDIERELRRIAYRSELATDARRLTIPRLLRVLLERELVSSQVVAVINEILPVCNDAIHGGEIPRDVALSVSSVGADVLSVLRGTVKVVKVGHLS